MKVRSVLLCAVILAGATPSYAQAPNAVTDWAAIVQPSITINGSSPRSGGTSQILHAMVVLAMYDAAIAIEGGFTPYASAIDAPPGADVRAAVATAAYRTARSRVGAPQATYLDERYGAYLLGIADGQSKIDGIAVGEAAAAGVLAARAGDGYGNIVPYYCSATPPPVGEFEPDSGCPTGPSSPQPADAKLGQIKPFTYSDPSRIRPDGPEPMTSEAYAKDFAETRAYGGLHSTVRSAEQTDVARFWSENPYVHWNRNLIALALAHDLDLRDTARLFAMAHTSAADAAIAGFEAKYFYVASRPRTAIPRADEDGNPSTEAEPSWRPLLSVNHPEYPSGHGFWSTAVLDAVAAFFGTDKVTWTLTTSKVAVPLLVRTERTYGSLNALMREVGDARVWAGLHWRHSIRHGEKIGRRIAFHVTRSYFLPVQ